MLYKDYYDVASDLYDLSVKLNVGNPEHNPQEVINRLAMGLSMLMSGDAKNEDLEYLYNFLNCLSKG